MKSMITQLKKASKSFFKKRGDNLCDIILFGSSMRGKPDPEEIDILLVFRKKVDKDIEYDLRKHFSDISEKISIISKTETGFKDASFDGREGILFEGYSLVSSKLIASDFGFVPLGLFIYDTFPLSNAEKTRFYYALNGRASAKGMIDALEGIKLSDNILAVPLEKIELSKEFFEHWGLKYKYVPSLIPQRLARKSIITKVR